MDRFSFTRRMLLAAAPALAFAGKADAQQDVTGLLLKPDGDPSSYEEMPLDAWTDIYGRPTAKVKLNGIGPFRFLVDTGSTTTVLRRADSLESSEQRQLERQL